MFKFILILTAIAGATDYYVGGSNASDANSGAAIGSPFATIAKAAEIMVAGDVCNIRAGVYRETVTPANSGSYDAPIIFQAYQEEKVTISGCNLVTGWSAHAGSIQKASMAWSMGLNNQIFVNGAVMVEARWPNDVDGKPMTPNAIAIQNGDTASITHTSIPGTADAWKGGSIWVLANKKWSSWVVPITGYDAGKKMVHFQLPSSAWVRDKHNPALGGLFYLAGSMAGLDVSSEWHYDSSQKSLYLIPPAGADLNSATVEAKARKWAINLAGKTSIIVRGIDVKGASVDMRDANGCTVDGMTAQHIWHHRGDGSASSLPENNGFLISGSGNQLLNSEIAYAASEGVSISGVENVIRNCFIHDFNYLGNYGAPVRITGPNTLSRSSVYNAGRDCIQFIGPMKIEYCDIYNSGMINHDLGVVYKGRTDGESEGTLAYNWIHNNLTEGPSSPCLYFDNFAKNYNVHHNVIWNCSGDAGIRVNRPTQGHRIYNNTLFNSDNIGTHTFTVADDPEYGTFDNKYDARNNLFLDDTPSTQLVDVGKKNFMLKAGADAIDSGVSIAGFTDGFIAAKPDLGAYEYGGTNWTAGASTTPVSTILVMNGSHRIAPFFSVRQIGGKMIFLTEVNDRAELSLYTLQGRIISRIIGEKGTRTLVLPMPASQMCVAKLTVDGMTSVLKVTGVAF